MYTYMYELGDLLFSLVCAYVSTISETADVEITTSDPLMIHIF